jgi:hypothetical protein
MAVYLWTAIFILPLLESLPDHKRITFIYYVSSEAM